MTITYDSVSILDANYITRIVGHESSPSRNINAIKLARRDGEYIINDSFNPKTITIEGILVGSTLANLDSRIDTLKELFSRKDKNLDIEFAGGTRRYVCRMTTCQIARDFYNIIHVPYKITFFIASGFGSDTSETTVLTDTGITAADTDQEVTFLGSHQPKPRHKITINTLGNADVVRITNEDTDEYMEVDLDGFSGSDYIEIDEEEQTVTKNGTTNLEFRGKFPSVVIGANNLNLTVYGAGYTLDQEQLSATGGYRSLLYDAGSSVRPEEAQSIIMDQSGRIGKISCFVGKDGSPTGKMQWYLRYDDNGKPMAGAAGRVGDADFDIAVAGVPATSAWTEAAVATGETFLIAGQRYWLMFNPGTVVTSDAANFFDWLYSNVPTDYTKGKAMANKATGQTWFDGVADASAGDGVEEGQFDLMFKIYRGDGAAVSHNIDWVIYYTKKYL